MKLKSIVASLVIARLVLVALTGQAATLLDESFQGALFPPSGWITNQLPADWAVWERRNVYGTTGMQYAAYAEGLGSALRVWDGTLWTPEIDCFAYTNVRIVVDQDYSYDPWGKDTEVFLYVMPGPGAGSNTLYASGPTSGWDSANLRAPQADAHHGVKFGFRLKDGPNMTGNGWRAYWKLFRVTVTADPRPVPPGAPAFIYLATNCYSNALYVAWPASALAQGYRLDQRARNSNGVWTGWSAKGRGPERHQFIDNLSPAYGYQYRVCATNGGGLSATVTSAVGVCHVSGLAAPYPVVASRGGAARRVDLTWIVNPVATRARIYGSAAEFNNAPTLLYQSPAACSSWTDTGVTAFETRYYWVCAGTADGSAWSLRGAPVEGLAGGAAGVTGALFLLLGY